MFRLHNVLVKDYEILIFESIYIFFLDKVIASDQAIFLIFHKIKLKKELHICISFDASS